MPTAGLGAFRDAPENAGHGLQPEAGRGCVLALIRAGHRLSALDELFIGHRLMESDEFDPTGGQEALVGGHQSGAVIRDRFPAQPNGLDSRAVGLSGTRRAVKDDVLRG